MKILSLVLLAGLVGSVSAVAQQPGGSVAATKPPVNVTYIGASQVAKAGQVSLIEVHFQVRDGFHLQSHTPKSELLIPTVFKLQPADGVKTTEVVYPAATPYSFSFSPAEKIDVYTGDFTVKVPVTATAGEHTLDATLRYQACDAKACYPPKTLPLQVSFTAK
jgi:hypothetical protein